MTRPWTFLLAIGGFLTVSMLVPFGPATEPPHAAPRARGVALLPPSLPPGVWEFEARDEWNGEDQAVLLEDRFSLAGATPGSSTRHVLRVPAEARVFPGTARMVFTVSVLDGGAETPVSIHYRSSDDRTGSLAFAGTGTHVLHVFESMNDWNLDPGTRWTFAASTEAPVGVSLLVRIEIVRGQSRDLVEQFPSLWGGRSEVALLREAGPLEDAGILGQSPTQVLGQRPSPAPRLSRPPPVGVDWLEVTLRYNSTTDRSLHYRPILSWRGADVEAPAWEVRGAAPDRVQRANRDGLFEWRLPVEPRMWDSLFGMGTRWALQVDWSGGVQAYHMEGDFSFRVVAHRSGAESPVAGS